jgi:hypothetical protein
MKERSVSVFVVLSLCFLAACGASQAVTPSSSTPKAAPTTLPLATSTPSPTPTSDRDPFQMHFLQHYQLIDCPVGPNPTALCYTLHDNPSTSSLGKVSFAGTDILYVRPQGSSCGPAERRGGIQADRRRHTVTIRATGTYCIPGYPVQFTYTVTGGTGSYQHAAGKGTIVVGPANNYPPTATEFWSGTIRQSS